MSLIDEFRVEMIQKEQGLRLDVDNLTKLTGRHQAHIDLM